jgi:hypothetical protein
MSNWTLQLDSLIFCLAKEWTQIYTHTTYLYLNKNSPTPGDGNWIWIWLYWDKKFRWYSTSSFLMTVPQNSLPLISSATSQTFDIQLSEKLTKFTFSTTSLLCTWPTRLLLPLCIYHLRAEQREPQMMLRNHTWQEVEALQPEFIISPMLTVAI